MKRESRSFRGEKGSGVMFFVAVIIPLFTVLLSITFDMIVFYSERSRVQQIVDDALIQGSHYLPHADQAKIVAEQWIAERDSELSKFVTFESSDSSHLSASGVFPVDTFFLRFIASSDSKSGHIDSIQFGLSGKVTVHPRDVVIVLDTSSYLAPKPGEDTWGTDNFWPAARIFPFPVAAPGGGDLDPKMATQQCFNPPFSALKEAAIRFYDYVAAFPMNSVGVLTIPGTIRDAGGVSEPVSVVRDTAVPGSGASKFDYYRAPGTPRSRAVSDELCLGIAEHLRPRSYRVPPLPDHLSHIESDSGTVVSKANFRLNPSFVSQLGPRKILWSRSVRQNNFRIDEALRAVRAQLLGTASRDDRSGAASEVQKTAVLFLGDFPRLGNIVYRSDESVKKIGEVVDNARIERVMSTELERIRKDAKRRGVKVKIFFVVPRHEGIYTSQLCQEDPDRAINQAISCPEFYQTDYLFSEFLKGEETKNLTLVSFRVPSTGSLAQDFIMAAPLYERSVLFSH